MATDSVYCRDGISTTRPGNGNRLMLRGVIKWYDESRGYGIIVPESGDKDVIFRAAQWSGDAPPASGDRVEYALIEARRGTETEWVRPASA